MCSIAGRIALQPAPNPEDSNEYLHQLFLACEQRGRDSWGFQTSRGKQARVVGRYSDTPENLAPGKQFSLAEDRGWLLANFRAEPTTEYISEKSMHDVQPFGCRGWYVVHNGTIANDKELISEFELSSFDELVTDIDSAIIPCLIASQFAADADFEDVARFLYSKLVGSYSLAIAHIARPNDLLLLCNYKPLYIMRDKALFCNEIYFASLPEYLTSRPLEERVRRGTIIEEVPAFHAMTFEGSPQWGFNVFDISTFDLREEAPSIFRPRALVVCSGGLDSTVVATLASKQYDVTLLHYAYECRAEEREVVAVKAIAESLGVPLVQIPTNIFKDVIGGSPLTSDLNAEIHHGDSGVEFAHEWVPARNLIMLSIAVGYAEAHGFDYIMLGNNLEESGAYPDNEMQFIRKLDAVLPYAVNVDKRVQLAMPVGNLMKHEIVKLGLEIGAPLDLCWSCYEAGDRHCGECGPCRMRKVAFEMNHADDVIQYIS